VAASSAECAERSSGARNAPQAEPRGSRGRQRRLSEARAADAIGVDAAEPVGDEPRREASAMQRPGDVAVEAEDEGVEYLWGLYSQLKTSMVWIPH